MTASGSHKKRGSKRSSALSCFFLKALHIASRSVDGLRFSSVLHKERSRMAKGMSPLRLLMRNPSRKTVPDSVEGNSSGQDSTDAAGQSRQPLGPITEIVRNPLIPVAEQSSGDPSTPRAKAKISSHGQEKFPHLENSEGHANSVNVTPDKSANLNSKGKFTWQHRHGSSAHTTSREAPPDLSTPPRPPRGSAFSDSQAAALSANNHDTLQGLSNNSRGGGTGGGSVSSTPKTGRSVGSKSTSDSENGGSQSQNATPKTVSRSLKYGQQVSASNSGASGLTSARSTPSQHLINRPTGYLQAVKGAVSQIANQNFVEHHFELEEDASFWRDHNIQVIIRTRPISNSEVAAQGSNRCLKQETPHTVTWLGQPESRFTFDHVAGETISQAKLFGVAGLPMVENCISGYNSCMFAYGQTGSGKTHTMLGDIEHLDRTPSENRGMTPRVFEYLFGRIQTEQECRRQEQLKFFCRCSFLEIYNEQITDLLEPSSTNLQMREDAKKGVYVENLSEVEVQCVQDVIRLLLQGAANRKVAATNMNRESSRSHSVFTCVVESKWENNSMTNSRYGRLHLVDLAGSERQKSSGAEGGRLKEAANINKSLSTLGLVIMILVDVANGKQRHVPYRDSKLTFLLQDSLGGNSKTIMIANVSPSSCSAMETLSTLKFAQRAKFIRNNAVINEDASGDVVVLRQRIEELKDEVDRLRRESILRISSSRVLALENGSAAVKRSHDKVDASVGCASASNSVNANKSLALSTVNNDKYLRSIEAVLEGALRREQQAEDITKKLAAEIEQLNRLVRQREEDSQCSKMILRFREEKIRRFESIADNVVSAEAFYEDERKSLIDELQLLRGRLDRNPELTRFAMENIRLMEELRRYQEFYDGGERDVLLEEISGLRSQLLHMLDTKLGEEQTVTRLTTPQKRALAPELSALERENELLLIEVKSYQNELKDCRNNLNSCLVANADLARQVDELQATVKQLQNESKEVPNIFPSTGANLASPQETASSPDAKTRPGTEELALQHRQALTNVEEQVSELRKQLKEAQNFIQKLSSEVAEAKVISEADDVNEKRMSDCSKRNENVTCIAENEAIARQGIQDRWGKLQEIEMRHSEEMTQLQLELDSMEDVLEEERQQRFGAEQTVEDLRSELTVAELKLDQAQSLEAVLEEERQQRLLVEQRVEDLRSKLSAAELKLDNAQPLEDVLEEERQQRLLAEQTVEDLRSQLSSAEFKLDQAQSLEDALEEERQQRLLAELRAEALRSTLSAAELKLDQAQPLEDVLEEERQQRMLAEQRVEDLRSKLSAAELKLDQAQSLEDVLEEERQQRMLAEQRLEDLRSKLSDAELELDQAQSLEDVLEEERQQRLLAEQNVEHLRSQLSVAELKLDQAQSLEDGLEEERQQRLLAEQRVEALRSNLGAAELKLDQAQSLEDVLEDERQQRLVAEQKSEELSSRLSVAVSDLEQAQCLVEALEGAQLFSINELENLQSEHSKLLSRMKRQEDEEVVLQQAYRDENSLNDPTVSILEQKLQKARRGKEEARRMNRQFQEEKASRMALDKEREVTMSEVETQAALAITTLQSEILELREEISLVVESEATAKLQTAHLQKEVEALQQTVRQLENNNNLLSENLDECKNLVDEKNAQLRRLEADWESATSKMIDYLADGDKALTEAADEMDDIKQGKLLKISQLDDHNLAKDRGADASMYHRLNGLHLMVRETEGKVRALSEAAAILDEETSDLKSEKGEALIRESEKKSMVAFLMVGQLLERIKDLKSAQHRLVQANEEAYSKEAAKEVESVALQQQLKELRSQFAQVHDERQLVVQKHEDLRQEYEKCFLELETANDLKAENVRLEKEFQESCGAVEEKDAENANLQEQLSDHRNQSAVMADRHQLLMAAHESLQQEQERYLEDKALKTEEAQTMIRLSERKALTLLVMVERLVSSRDELEAANLDLAKEIQDERLLVEQKHTALAAMGQQADQKNHQYEEIAEQFQLLAETHASLRQEHEKLLAEKALRVEEGEAMVKSSERKAIAAFVIVKEILERMKELKVINTSLTNQIQDAYLSLAEKDSTVVALHKEISQHLEIARSHQVLTEAHENLRQDHERLVQEKVLTSEDGERAIKMSERKAMASFLMLGKVVDGKKELKRESERLEREIQEANKALVEKNAEIVALEQKLEYSGSGFTEIADQHQVLKGEHHTLREEYERVQEQLEKAQGGQERLQAELEKAREGQDGLDQELVKAGEELKSLHEELAQLREEHERLQEQLEKARGDQESLQVELEKAREGQDGLDLELVKAGEEQKSLHEELAKLREEHERLQEQLEKARGEHESLQAELETAREGQDGLDQELVKAGEEQKSLHEELAKLREEHERLQQQLEKARGEQERLQAELETARGEQERLQAELETARGEQERLQAELETAREGQDGLDQELVKAGEEQKSLHEELAKSHEEHERLQEQFEKAQGGQERLQEELERARQGQDALQEELVKLVEEQERLHEELAKSREELERLQEELEKAREEQERVTSDLEKAQEEEERSLRDNASSVEHQEQMIKLSEKKAMGALVVVEHLMETLEVLKTTESRLEKQIEEFHFGHSEKDTRLVVLERHLEESHSSQKELCAENRSVVGKYEKLKEEHETCVVENGDLRQRVEALESDLRNYHAQVKLLQEMSVTSEQQCTAVFTNVLNIAVKADSVHEVEMAESVEFMTNLGEGLDLLWHELSHVERAVDHFGSVENELSACRSKSLMLEEESGGNRYEMGSLHTEISRLRTMLQLKESDLQMTLEKEAASSREWEEAKVTYVSEKEQSRREYCEKEEMVQSLLVQVQRLHSTVQGTELRVSDLLTSVQALTVAKDELEFENSRLALVAREAETNCREKELEMAAIQCDIAEVQAKLSAAELREQSVSVRMEDLAAVSVEWEIERAVVEHQMQEMREETHRLQLYLSYLNLEVEKREMVILESLRRSQEALEIVDARMAAINQELAGSEMTKGILEHDMELLESAASGDVSDLEGKELECLELKRKLGTAEVQIIQMQTAIDLATSQLALEKSNREAEKRRMEEEKGACEAKLRDEIASAELMLLSTEGNLKDEVQRLHSSLKLTELRVSEMLTGVKALTVAKEELELEKSKLVEAVRLSEMHCSKKEQEFIAIQGDLAQVRTSLMEAKLREQEISGQMEELAGAEIKWEVEGELLKRKIEEMTEERGRLHFGLGSANAEVEEREIAILESFRKSQEALERVEARLTTMDQELGGLEMTTGNVEHDIALLDSAAAINLAALEGTEQKYLQMQRRVEDAEMQMSQMQTARDLAIAQIVLERDNWEADKRSVKEDRDSRETELRDEIAGAELKFAAMEANLKAAVESVEALGMRKTELEEEILQLNEDAKVSLEKVTEQQQEIDTLRDMSRALKAECSEADEKISALNHLREEYVLAEARWKSEQELLTKKVEDLEFSAARSNMEAGSKDPSRDSREGQVSQCLPECQNRSEESQQLHMQRQDNQALRAKVSDKERTILSAKKEMEKAIANFKEAELEMDKAQRQNQKLTILQRENNSLIDSLSFELKTAEEELLKRDIKIEGCEVELRKVAGIMSDWETKMHNVESEWRREKELLAQELTEAKLVANEKRTEAAVLLQKFQDGQTTMKEAEDLVHALVKANENAKHDALDWKTEKESLGIVQGWWMPERDKLVSEVARLETDLHRQKQDFWIMCKDAVIGSVDTMDILLVVEQELSEMKNDYQQEMEHIVRDMALLKDDLGALLQCPVDLRLDLDCLFNGYRNQTERWMAVEGNQSVEMLSELGAELKRRTKEIQGLEQRLFELEGEKAKSFENMQTVVCELTSERDRALKDSADLRVNVASLEAYTRSLEVQLEEKSCEYLTNHLDQADMTAFAVEDNDYARISRQTGGMIEQEQTVALSEAKLESMGKMLELEGYSDPNKEEALKFMHIELEHARSELARVQETVCHLQAELKDQTNALVDYHEQRRSAEANSQLQVTRIDQSNQLLQLYQQELSLTQDILTDCLVVSETLVSQMHELSFELEELMLQRVETVVQNVSSDFEVMKVEIQNFRQVVQEEVRVWKLRGFVTEQDNERLVAAVEDLQSRNSVLNVELNDHRRSIDILAEELVVKEQRMAHSLQLMKSQLKAVEDERDKYQTDLVVLNEQLEMAQTLADEHCLVSAQARQAAELSKSHAEQKEEEIRILDRSVEELERTVYALESQLGIVKRESDKQHVAREELEKELETLKVTIDSQEAQTARDCQDAETSKTELDRIVIEMKNQQIQARKSVESLQQECAEKDVQLRSCKSHIAELLLGAEKQASENQQKLKALESMLEHLKVEERKVNPGGGSASKSVEKSAGKVKGSGSPFKCIGSGLERQRTSEMDEDLSSAKKRIKELEAVAASRQKEVFMLNTKLAEAESMTHDVVRDLLGVKMDIASYATLLNQQQVQRIAERARRRTVEAQEKEEELDTLRDRLNEFIEERESWLEEINRRQAEAVAARVSAEKLRLRDQTLTAENDRFREDCQALRKKVTDLEDEIKKLSGQQNLQQRIHHHAKIKEENNSLRLQTEDLSGKLRRMEILFTRVNDELARYRTAEGRSAFLNFDEEARLQKKLQETEETRLQLAETLIGLCTGIMQAAGIQTASRDLDPSTAMTALQELQDRQDSLERELSDYKLKARIAVEKRRLSDLREFHTPVKTICTSTNFTASQQLPSPVSSSR